MGVQDPSENEAHSHSDNATRDVEKSGQIKGVEQENVLANLEEHTVHRPQEENLTDGCMLNTVDDNFQFSENYNNDIMAAGDMESNAIDTQEGRETSKKNETEQTEGIDLDNAAFVGKHRRNNSCDLEDKETYSCC